MLVGFTVYMNKRHLRQMCRGAGVLTLVGREAPLHYQPSQSCLDTGGEEGNTGRFRRVRYRQFRKIYHISRFPFSCIIVVVRCRDLDPCECSIDVLTSSPQCGSASTPPFGFHGSPY
jgi:hypothetical protein